MVAAALEWRREEGLDEQEAAAVGLAAENNEFRDTGGEIYRPYEPTGVYGLRRQVGLSPTGAKSA